MRREDKRKVQKLTTSTDKVILYTGIGVLVLAVIVFALFMYSKGLNDDVKNSTMNLEKIASIAGNNTQNNTQNSEQENAENTAEVNEEDTESASTEIGKSVEDSKNELENNANQANIANNITNNMQATNTTKNVTTNTMKNATETNAQSNEAKSTDTSTAQKEEQTEITTQKELSFEKPVEGEIVREYAKDNLIYSATLDEWTTHSGIDIQAEKTTVVKSAEAGTVKSIKNDPRYGLTIVVEHANNFQTVYSNLLTSEFVVEGEKVEKGQALGTVGNTAVFEIADEPHLHFEILKDNIPEDPSIYIK